MSPDGKRVAVNTDDGKEAIVWIYDVSGVTAIRRVTFGGNNRFPIWTADGKRIVFQSDRDNDRSIFWQDADGIAPAERLTAAGAGESHVPESWSPLGDTLLFTVSKGVDMSLWMLSVREGRIVPFDSVHSSSPTNAVFSPNGRWVAYAATERSKTTVYVQPVPPTGAKYEVFASPTDNPHHPMWSPDGRELFVDPRAGGFVAIPVTTTPTFAFGNPVELSSAVHVQR